jgi:hypothetical protein
MRNRSILLLFSSTSRNTLPSAIAVLSGQANGKGTSSMRWIIFKECMLALCQGSEGPWRTTVL